MLKLVMSLQKRYWISLTSEEIRVENTDALQTTLVEMNQQRCSLMWSVRSCIWPFFDTSLYWQGLVMFNFSPFHVSKHIAIIMLLVCSFMVVLLVPRVKCPLYYKFPIDCSLKHLFKTNARPHVAFWHRFRPVFARPINFRWVVNVLSGCF